MNCYTLVSLVFFFVCLRRHQGQPLRRHLSRGKLDDTVQNKYIIFNCKTAHLHVNFRSFSECENISLLRIVFSIRAQFAMFSTVADLGKGPAGTRSPLPLILGEKVRIAEGRKAAPSLSSSSGSATAVYQQNFSS